MNGILLTRPGWGRPVRRRMAMAVVIAAVYPSGTSWADAITLQSQTSIRGLAVLKTSSGSLFGDTLDVLTDFTAHSQELGPVTLSGAFGGTGFPLLDASLATTMTSVVQPTAIRVNGSTRADAIAVIPPGNRLTSVEAQASALASSHATFALTAPHVFDASLALDGIAGATLTDATRGDVFTRQASVGNFASFGALNGTLAPGDYTLSVFVNSFAFASAITLFPSSSESERSTVDLDFTLTPAATPEPASVILLGADLLGLIARARTHKNRTA
jgi:hypothetical protein